MEEKFQNHLLNMIGKQHGFPDLDWSFGPVLFRRALAWCWLEYEGNSYDGNSYDSQWAPLIRSVQGGTRVGAPLVDYQHSEAMKAQEEGDVGFALKRLAQLNSCVAVFQTMW